MENEFAIKSDVLLLYLGDAPNISIPEGITKIEKNAFKGNKNLKHVDIPDSVIEIGAGAFCDCIGLQKVKLPAKLKKIPNSLFKNCKSLEEMSVPEEVERIGSYAFNNCAKLNVLSLPEGLKEISTHAFEGCLSLKTVTIPNSVTEIGAYAFRWCDVSEVTLPATLKKIPNALFYSCRCLCSIAIPDTVEEIGVEAFCGSRLETITIPNNVTKIEKGALSSGGFNGCLFEKVKLPETQTEIVPYMFEGCDGIIEIVIPSHIKKIDENAFSNCYNLKKLVIPDGVEVIDAKAFGECRGLTEVIIPYSITFVSADTFGTTDYYDRLISGQSFGCKNIKNLTVPSHIFSKGFFEFNWCDRLYAHEGITLIKSSKFMHFFEATLQAVRKGVDTLKSLGEDNLTIYAPSGSIAATYAVDNAIKHIETPKTKHLQVIYQRDAVDKLESWMKRCQIPKELFDAVYIAPAKELKAKKCIKFLKNWKAENL